MIQLLSAARLIRNWNLRPRLLKIMIWIWLAIICIAWLGIALFLQWKVSDELDWFGGIATSLVFLVVFLGISGISILVSRYSHYDDFALYYKTEADMKILEDRKEVLTFKFSSLLDSKYLEHESKLFEEMSNEDVEMLFTKYPELKANTTLMNLVEKIFSLNDAVYDKHLFLNKVRKDIQMRYKDPTVIPFFLPDVPFDIVLLNK